MNEPRQSEKTIRKIKCAVCDFEVYDSEENELLIVIQSHAKRKHSKDFTLEQLRPHLIEVKA